jgi:aminopeptidase N
MTRPGMPTLKGGWRYDAATKKLSIELSQVKSQTHYRIPLEIAIGSATGQPRIMKVELTELTHVFVFDNETEPASVTLDPNTWVLMQVEEFVKR